MANVRHKLIALISTGIAVVLTISISLQTTERNVAVPLSPVRKDSRRIVNAEISNSMEKALCSSPLDLGTFQYRAIVVASGIFWTWKMKLPRVVSCKGSSNTSVLLEWANLDTLSVSDILIFSGKVPAPEVWLELESRRRPNQVWVFTTEESPHTSRAGIPPPSLSHILFNVSYTYHSQSDISIPYGAFLPFTEGQKSRVKFKSNFHQKKGVIAWISSHCSTSMWGRSDFIHDLDEYISIDTYGECGQLTCPKHEFSKCQEVFASYMFIAGLENSCCGEYITEKFWNALTAYDAIPVVVGAPKKDYERLAPLNSFIHADDFNSLKQLADYIKTVSTDKELYDSYFQWKKVGKTVVNPIKHILAFTDDGVCNVVEFLRREQNDSDKLLNRKVAFDPYGPNWFGGCNKCGQHKWLQQYSKFESSDFV